MPLIFLKNEPPDIPALSVDEECPPPERRHDIYLLSPATGHYSSIWFTSIVPHMLVCPLLVCPLLVSLLTHYHWSLNHHWILMRNAIRVLCWGNLLKQKTVMSHRPGCTTPRVLFPSEPLLRDEQHPNQIQVFETIVAAMLIVFVHFPGLPRIFC